MREDSELLCFPGGLGELEKGNPPTQRAWGGNIFWKTIFKLNSKQKRECVWRVYLEEPGLPAYSHILAAKKEVSVSWDMKLIPQT